MGAAQVLRLLRSVSKALQRHSDCQESAVDLRSAIIECLSQDARSLTGATPSELAALGR